jgi:very-short-patch-repair endonuclease
MHPTDDSVRTLAAGQMGRFTRAQVASLDPAHHSLVQRRIRSGAWLRQTSRVLCLPGAPLDPIGSLWTVHLHFGAGATLSHWSAAVAHAFPHVEPRRFEIPSVTVAHGSHRRTELCRVHQSRTLADVERTVVGGLPVTTIARTLVDLAPLVSGARLEAWIDHFAAERLLLPRDLIAVTGHLEGPARQGIAPVVALVADRTSGTGIEQGRLERSLTAVLRLAGLGDGIAQFPHPGRADGTEVVDRAFPAARLVIEADGRRWHARRAASAVDKRRDRMAAAEGWLTVRYEWDDLEGPAAAASAHELRTIHDSRLGG